MLLALGLGLVGCGEESSTGQDQTTRELKMVTVNWIEGLAMSYVQARILEDSLGMDITVNEVQGGGLAFQAVASGAADVFNEAWLPTTHRAPWSKNKDRSQKLGYTYKGTSVGIAVPTYTAIDTVPDLARYREKLDGTINGIEPGAAINGQIDRTLERYEMADAFSVTASSGPATWQALRAAVDDGEPIAVAAWKPHWKWNAFDLRYVDGARTGHNVDIWGQPEDIFTIVGNDFVDRFPKPAVCFLKEFEATDRQVGSLMDAFRNREDRSKPQAARRWIENHRSDVAGWLEQAETCAASDQPVQLLPDDATYSSPDSAN